MTIGVESLDDDECWGDDWEDDFSSSPSWLAAEAGRDLFELGLDLVSVDTVGPSSSMLGEYCETFTGPGSFLTARDKCS